MDYQSHLIYAVEFTVNDRTWVVVAPLKNSTFRYADKDAIRLPEDIAFQIEYIKDLPNRETYLLTCKGYDQPVELNKIAAKIVDSKKYLHQFHDYRQLFSWVERQLAVPAADVPVKTNEQTYDFYRNIYAIVSSATNEVQVLTIVPEISKFMFFPINGRQCRPRFFDTGHECVEDAIADGLKVYEFKSDIEYYGWLGKLYAVPVLPFNGVVPRPADSERINILEERVSRLQNFWSLRFSDMLKKIEKSKDTQPSENRDGQNREDGFYIVNRPPLPIPFVAQSINGKWYIPGEKLHYGGYLRVHSKVDMGE